MIHRHSVGLLPAKPHTALRDAAGNLHFEECFTRDGFDGAYSILYHQRKPHTAMATSLPAGWALPVAAEPAPSLQRRHYPSPALASRGGAPINARVPLLFNEDVVISVAFPDAPDPVYFADGDADTLVYVFTGGGTLRSQFGDLPFTTGDYVIIPRGVIHRFLPTPGVPHHWFIVEAAGGLSIPRQWRNDTGQLRMDAPYGHRDFRLPTFIGPADEGIRDQVVKRGGFHGYRHDHAPLDVVGWDGSVYPFAFPILAFQPRVGAIHLPPTWHGTFAARGALVCSFVPRPLDFHPDAIPCPYPHSSVHCDEVIFYCRGHFTSRRGVGAGSVSHHPMGIPHGPHPGAYEASIGRTHTDELAVMLDTFRPLARTAAARTIEDPGYHASFAG